MNKSRVCFIFGMILIAALVISGSIPIAKSGVIPIPYMIDNGIGWLAAQQNTDGSWGEYYYVGQTGLAVLKLETYAMDLGLDPLDPSYAYCTNVSNGLNYIFSQAHNVSINMQDGHNPDSNGNGIGVAIYYDAEMYDDGIAAAAIAHCGHPNMVVTAPGDAHGRTYEDVLTDLVDYIAWAQTDSDAGDYRGGWRYGPNAGDSDNSVTGYVVLGLVYAESPPPFGFGITIPAFVKTELNYWINYIQNHDVTDVDNYGGSGYDYNVTANMLRTGTLLQEMRFVGDTLSTQRVQDAIGYIERHWDDANTEPGWKGNFSEGVLAYKQSMFTLMKGFTAFGINTITVQRGGNPVTVNWYDEMASMLDAQKNPDHSWSPGGADDINDILSTSWALLVLEKAAPQILISIESCDVNGVTKDSFAPSDTVYVKGGGYAPSTSYDLYVVEDKATWTAGDALVRVPGTTATITSDTSGNIPPTIAWNPGLTPGKYDIVVDLNHNGHYDEGEPLDNNDIVTTAGFLVIPEYWMGAILGLVGCFAALGAFRITKRKHQ
jgi:hypothetical protein